MTHLLDAGAAVRADLPVGIEWSVTGRADVAHLRVADGTDHEVAVDGGAALGADAVVRELVLAQGNVEVLLLTVDEVGARAQDNVREDAHNRDDRYDGPDPPRLGATALRVADDVDDGQDVHHHDASHHQVEHHADLGGQELVEKFTRATREGTSLPILAKLTPNVTDMVPMALAAKRGGADGISAINTINSITGIDIEKLVAEPAVSGKSIVGGYSGAAVRPIALRFISDISRCEELSGMHISGMGGVETWQDAIEFILLGAGSVQVTTAVMQYGQRIISDILEGLEAYMRVKGIDSVRDLIGGAAHTVVDHQSIERDTILYPVFNHERCNGCGRCYISCRDGGHQAIKFDEVARRPLLIGSKCVGCHLCRLVCSEKAIMTAKKTIKKQ